MKKKKINDIFRIMPHAELLIVDLFIFVTWFSTIIVRTSLNYSAAYNLIAIILIILLPIIMAIFSFLQFFLGWNSIVYFDDKKIYKKIKGRFYYWYYEDSIKISCRTHKNIFMRWPPYPPRVKITCGTHSKTLSFPCDRRVQKKFLECCSNGNLKQEFSILMKKVDFPYL